MRNTLLLAVLLATASLHAADVEHAFQSTVPRGAVQRVLIDIPFGSFTVRSGQPGQLVLSGIASRDFDGGRERSWAQKVVDDISVEFYVNGAEAVVRRRFGPDAQSWRAQRFTGLDLRLDLPPGVDVRFETSAGEIHMDGHFGHVDIDLRAGEIDLRMPRASVRELRASARIGEVRTHIGNERVTREGVFPGKTTWFNAAGHAKVNVHVTTGEVDVTLTQ